MKKLLLVLTIVSLLTVAAACSASQESGPGMVTPGTTMIPPAPPGYDENKGAPPITITTTATTTRTPSGAGSGAESPALPAERMIIRTASLQLVVSDVAVSIEQITVLAGSYGGFVVSSNSWLDRDRLMGNISFRVAAENFDAAIAALHGLADDVRSESTSGQDVTEEYVDLTARLTNLEAAEAQLLKLMEQAGDVSDILEVQRELVKTRGEIEQTKGRMQYLEQSSAMSLIQVSLEQSKLTVEFNAGTRNVKEGARVQFFPDISGGFGPYSYAWDFGDGAASTEDSPSHAYKSDGTYTVSLTVTDDRGNTESYEREDYITVLPGWDAGGVAGGAWNVLVGFSRALADIFIWLGIFSPVWIVILVILYFAWWRRRKGKKASGA
jgi:hypothetical protein